MDPRQAAQRKAILAKLKASGFVTSKPVEPEESSEDQDYNFEKLKTFHIPRKREQHGEKELLTTLDLKSREYIHTLLPAVKSSYFYSHSQRRIKINKVEVVHNAVLEKEFLERKRDMKSDGRSDKELSECFGFTYTAVAQEAEVICQAGLHTGNSKLVSLGKHDMAVYLSRHADVITPNNFEADQQGCIVMFKIIKGKSKVVTECRLSVTTQEPTPLFDCHTLKVSVEQAKASHQRAYQMLQYYIYEYGDVDVLNRPRQIIPYAILHFNYLVNENTLQRKDSNPALEADAGPSGTSPTGLGVSRGVYNLWEGRLLVRGGQFCAVKLVTEIDTAINIAFLDKTMNVKYCLSVDKFSRLLPPSLLNKSGKKYNVIYRGRNYSIFHLVPLSESGVPKFRQLIAHLVQSVSVGVVKLKFSSMLYFMPMSGLTMDKMGLAIPSVADPMMKKVFLYAVVVTPKALASKINEQRSNIVVNRKRKDHREDTKIPEELEMKLGNLNIDPASIGSLVPEQMSRLLGVLKDKKKLQTSEKLLHSHYKTTDPLFPSHTNSKKFLGKMTSLWAMTHQSRTDYYKPKTKKKSVSRSNSSSRLKRAGTPGVESDEEATFSADDDDVINDITDDVITPPSDPRPPKRKISIEPPMEAKPKIARPSFKPLEVVLTSEDMEELMQHPDFSLSSRYEVTHHVTTGSSFKPTMDVDKLKRREDMKQHGQLSIVFRQAVPFQTTSDCPYAFEGDATIKSMLRGIYGPWKEDTTEDAHSSLEKVRWVRQVLFRNKTAQGGLMIKQERKIVEDNKIKQGGSSGDTGSSADSTTTPSSATPSSLQNFANLLANVLQDKPQDGTRVSTEADSTNNEIQATTQNILQALAKTVDEKGLEFPDLKEAMNDMQDKGGEQAKTSHPVASPPCAPDSTTKQSPIMTSQKTPPQEWRKMKTVSPRHLRLPSYPFPPSNLALLPLDGRIPSPRISKTHTTLETPQSNTGGHHTTPGTPLLPSPTKRTHHTGIAPPHPLGGPYITRNPPQGPDKGPHHPRVHPYWHGGPLTLTPAPPNPRDPRTHPLHTRGTVKTPGKHTAPNITPNTMITPTIGGTRATMAQTSVANPIGSNRGATTPTEVDPSELARSVLQKLGILPGTYPKIDPHTQTGPHKGPQTDSRPLTGPHKGTHLQTGPHPQIDPLPPKGGVLTHNTHLLLASGSSGKVTTTAGSAPSEGSEKCQLFSDRIVKTFKTSTLQPNTNFVVEIKNTLSAAPTVSAAQDRNNNLIHIKLLENVGKEDKIPVLKDQDIAKIRSKDRNRNLIEIELVENEKTEDKTPVVKDGDAGHISVKDKNDNLTKSLVKNVENFGEEKLGEKGSKDKDVAGISVEGKDDSNPPKVELSEDYIKKMREKLKKRRSEKKIRKEVDASRHPDQEDLPVSHNQKPTSSVDLDQSSAFPTFTKPSKDIPSTSSMAEAYVALERLPKSLEPTYMPRYQAHTYTSTPATTGEQNPISNNLISKNLAPTSRDTTLESNVEASVSKELIPTFENQTSTLSYQASTSRKEDPSSNDDITMPERTLTSKIQSPTCKEQAPASMEQAPATNPSFLSEIDDILSKVRSAATDASSSALSSRLLQLALQLQTSGTKEESSGSSEKVKSDDSLRKNDETVEKLGRNDETSRQLGLEAKRGRLIQTEDTKGQTSSSSKNLDEISDKVASEVEDIVSSDDVRETHTPTLDDTYDHNLAEDMKSNMHTSYLNLNKLSTLSRPVIPTSSKIQHILEKMTNLTRPKVDNLELKPVVLSTRVEKFVKLVVESFLKGVESKLTSDDSQSPLPKSAESPSKPAKSRSKSVESLSEITESAESHLKPAESLSKTAESQVKPTTHENSFQKSRSLEKRSVAHVKPQPGNTPPPKGPRFYIFNPRGHPDCSEMEDLLHSLKGVRFHPHDVTNAITRMTSSEEGGIPVNEELLHKVLPPEHLWIVIRSGDLELLPSLPYLGLLKCAGARVQFVQADSACAVRDHQYLNILNGEGGIIIPVSANVMLNNHAVFFQLFVWLVSTGNLPSRSNGSNVWRMALYDHIRSHLHSIKQSEVPSTEDQFKFSHAVLRMLEDNPRSTIQVKSDEHDPTPSEVFDAAIGLQLKHAQNTRHVVVLVDQDHKIHHWRALRKAGVAVATVNQFIGAILEENVARDKQDVTQRFSPIMKIYNVQRC
ncbi:uncharacterized protein LOC101243233 [Ciona intestinalis]